jgi:ABC-type sugar transport system ATPase subunit
MFVIENLDFKVNDFHLKVDHLDLTSHRTAALMGPSGSGKTTFMNILIGIHKPQNWSWILNGKEMAGLELDQRHLGIVFQNNELFPHLSAEENIKIVMRSRHVTGEMDYLNLEKFKNKLNLSSCWENRAENLSGGEVQRVSLLRAVMSRPQMLLLDEPFSSLDADLKSEARKLTAEIVQEANLPTLLITHDIEDAKALAAHVVHIQNGRIKSI